jgi:hypothetical protein
MDVAVRHTRCLDYNASDRFADVITTSGSGNDLDKAKLLQCLNNEKAFLYLPVIVFLGVLTLVGTLGNALVLVVYCRKTYKVRIFTLTLTLTLKSNGGS